MPPKTKAPHVIVHKGNLTGRIHEITRKITTIGREVGNDIVVNDVSVSRVHARIICVDEQAPAFILEDMGSTNGTFVNGKQLQGSMPINFNDEILLAQDVYVIIKNGIFPGTDLPAINEPMPRTEKVDLRQLSASTPLHNPNTRKIENESYEGMTLEDLEYISDHQTGNLSPARVKQVENDPADDAMASEDPTTPDYNHIFVSYSRTDQEMMRRITETLQTEGLRVWVDKQKLAPGISSWRRAIQNAIDHSGCVLVILSPDARKSKWVEAELDYAETQHKKIFCVLARGDRATSALLGYTLSQWVDVQLDYERAMIDLLSEVKKHLNLE